MNARAEKRITDVTGSLLANNMFFGASVLELQMQPTEQQSLVTCDGTTLGYNEDMVNKASAEKIKAEIGRMILGCCLKHHTRREERDPNLWHQAHLDVTQPLLKDADLTSEPGGVNMSIEERYDELKKDQDKDNKDKDQPPQPPKTPNQVPDDNRGKINDAPKPNKKEDQKNEQPENGDQEGLGSGLTPKEKDAEEQKWDDIVHKSFQFAKAQGKGPGAIQNIIESSHKPRLKWQIILQHFIKEPARDDYSWMRPNPRFISQGLYLPAIYSEKLPPMYFVIDTSASMADTHVGWIWEEVKKGVKDNKIEEVHVFQADDALQSVERYKASKLPKKLLRKGYGGTSFFHVFEYLKKNRIRPACLIYLTDLEGQFPPKPKFPVIWCSNNYNPEVKAPWGKTINILTDRERQIFGEQFTGAFSGYI